jgi:hypothetical protein
LSQSWTAGATQTRLPNVSNEPWDEPESFTPFAKVRLAAGDAEPSLEELFDLWRIEHPSESGCAENISAIAGAIAAGRTSVASR